MARRAVLALLAVALLGMASMAVARPLLGRVEGGSEPGEEA